jgi:hypothetical protein
VVRWSGQSELQDGWLQAHVVRVNLHVEGDTAGQESTLAEMRSSWRGTGVERGRHDARSGMVNPIFCSVPG